MAEHHDESPVEESTNSNVMELLSEHVPLSLIVDLSAPQGPDSEDILSSEGVPEDSWWVQVGADPSGDDVSVVDEDEDA